MAVPKRKQSHSRTTKRRSQHRISPPAVSPCPQCGAERLPHRICSQCGAYGGRAVLAGADHGHDHDHSHDGHSHEH